MSIEKPLTIFVHVHYPDIWRNMADVLAERIDVPFRLFVTTSQSAESIELPQSPHLVSANVLQFENRGRDILPFIRALAEAGEFDIAIKLHTKKSPQRSDGAAWLNELVDTLLPAHAGVSAIAGRLRDDARIGLVAPTGFCLSVRPWIFVNGAAMENIMTKLGHQLVDADLDDAFFAAGSMFWFRRQIFEAFNGAALTPLFEAEEGQLDGTAAHAFERLFGVEARRQGFVTLSTDALTASNPDMSVDELTALARDHADRPNVYFPAPGLSGGAALEPEPSAASPQRNRWLVSLYRACPPEVQVWLRRVIAR